MGTLVEAPVESPGIEGNYDEIIAYLDKWPVNGVQWADSSHGVPQSDETGGHPLNFGLFSINEDVTRKASSSTIFDRELVNVQGVFVDVEDPENSHRIIF